MSVVMMVFYLLGACWPVDRAIGDGSLRHWRGFLPWLVFSSVGVCRVVALLANPKILTKREIVSPLNRNASLRRAHYLSRRDVMRFNGGCGSVFIGGLMLPCSTAHRYFRMLYHTGDRSVVTSRYWPLIVR